MKLSANNLIMLLASSLVIGCTESTEKPKEVDFIQILENPIPSYEESVAFHIGKFISKCLNEGQAASNCDFSSNEYNWKLPSEFFNLPMNQGKNGKIWQSDDASSYIVKAHPISDDLILAITATRKSHMFNCRGCTPIIGAIKFSNVNNNLLPISGSLFLDFQGTWGRIKSESIRIISSNGSFSVKNSSSGQGYYTVYESIYGFENGSYSKIWNGITSENNSGACGYDPDGKLISECYDYRYEITFENNSSSDYPNLILNSTKTGKPPKSYKGDKVTFKYNGTQYIQVKP